MPPPEIPAVPDKFLRVREGFLLSGEGYKVLAVSPSPLALRVLPDSATGSEVWRVFSMHTPGLRFLGITPGFYPGVTRPVRSILRPRFSSIIPGFYPGFTIRYYFQGPARPKRLFPYGDPLFLVSFNTVALQFAN